MMAGFRARKRGSILRESPAAKLLFIKQTPVAYPHYLRLHPPTHPLLVHQPVGSQGMEIMMVLLM